MLTVDTSSFLPGLHDLWILQTRGDRIEHGLVRVGRERINFLFPGSQGAGDVELVSADLTLAIKPGEAVRLQKVGCCIERIGSGNDYLYLFASEADLIRGIKQIMKDTDSRALYTDLDHALKEIQ